MSVSPFEGEAAYDDVAWVAEMANEPMYLTEIARKLLATGAWDTSLNNAIRKVSLAVQAYTDERDPDEFRLEEIQPGQREGSMHYVLGEGGDVFGGVSGSREWRPYKLFQSDTEVVSEPIGDTIDTSITFEEKKRMVERISETGRRQSMIAEEILQDVVDKVTRDVDVFEKTGFQSPKPDVYVENFDLLLPVVIKDIKRGKVIEVTNRWENPIDRPYIEDKFGAAMDKEATTNVPVDVLIIAPRLAGDIAVKAEEHGGEKVIPVDDEGIVSVAIAPKVGNGIPVIRSDPFAMKQRLVGTRLVGSGYPAAEEPFEGFVRDLDHVEREYNIVLESDYRLREIEPVVTAFLSE